MSRGEEAEQEPLDPGPSEKALGACRLRFTLLRKRVEPGYHVLFLAVLCRHLETPWNHVMHLGTGEK